MTKRNKRLAAIHCNPREVRFDDACAAAEMIGFSRKGGEGSHRVYAREDEPAILNFQSRQGLIPAYQARQLIAMLDKYEEE